MSGCQKILSSAANKKNSNSPTIIFAGGGTGGHIYPNIAIYQALTKHNTEIKPLFLISKRDTDKKILEDNNLPFLQLPANPLRPNVTGVIKFIKGYIDAKRYTKKLLTNYQNNAVMVATGGFVSAPAMAAAKEKGLPTALVNLDATAGKANKQIAKKVKKIFSVYKNSGLKGAKIIGMPLRENAKANLAPNKAKNFLEMDANKPMLFITAGSLGASSINSMMIALCESGRASSILNGWQVYHLCGSGKNNHLHRLKNAYSSAKVNAKIEPFSNTMGTCWAAADLAISRAGASSVAEVHANGVLAIFMPYPYHKDNHQKKNAQPLVDCGGAIMLDDLIDGDKNCRQIEKSLSSLIADKAQREKMRNNLKQTRADDGSEAVAKWLLNSLLAVND